jgi:flagellar biosynthetic protein FliQ
MDELNIMSAFKDMLVVTMMTVCLITIPTLIVGVLISIIQVATQINEMTITFIPKLIVMFTVLLASLPWLLERLVNFTQDLMNNIPSYIR